MFIGKESNTTVKNSLVILYEGDLRTIINRVQPIFMGYIDNSEVEGQVVLVKEVQSNKNINLALISGQFIPQINLNSYRSSLIYLQNISSVLPVVLINLTEQDQLFSELFYMPQSQTYQSYLWCLALPNSMVIMGINPFIFHTHKNNSDLDVIGSIL